VNHDHDLAFTLAAHVTIFLTTVAGFVFAWLREGRRHKWQKEENAKMRAEVSDLKTEVKNGHGKTP
jgi:hypothetical protein